MRRDTHVGRHPGLRWRRGGRTTTCGSAGQRGRSFNTLLPLQLLLLHFFSVLLRGLFCLLLDLDLLHSVLGQNRYKVIRHWCMKLELASKQFEVVQLDVLLGTCGRALGFLCLSDAQLLIVRELLERVGDISNVIFCLILCLLLRLCG